MRYARSLIHSLLLMTLQNVDRTQYGFRLFSPSRLLLAFFSVTRVQTLTHSMRDGLLIYLSLEESYRNILGYP